MASRRGELPSVSPRDFGSLVIDLPPLTLSLPPILPSSYLARTSIADRRFRFDSSLLFLHVTGFLSIDLEITEDLATEIELESEVAAANEGVVRALYTALSDAEFAQKVVITLVVPDLDYWYHGPPRQDHMMRLLTGATSCESFRFQPVRFFSHGNRVFVEGKHPSRRNVFWVHIWTLKDGLVTQLREYFNTAVLVTDLTQSPPSAELVRSHPCSTVWQSLLWKAKEGKSVPGLVLAI